MLFPCSREISTACQRAIQNITNMLDNIREYLHAGPLILISSELNNQIKEDIFLLFPVTLSF
jgi:hypothetical protein